MWAYGMVLYEMAVAYKPSQVKGYNPESGEIPFRKYDWKGRSEELKKFNNCMHEFGSRKKNYSWRSFTTSILYCSNLILDKARFLKSIDNHFCDKNDFIFRFEIFYIFYFYIKDLCILKLF